MPTAEVRRQLGLIRPLWRLLPARREDPAIIALQRRIIDAYKAASAGRPVRQHSQIYSAWNCSHPDQIAELRQAQDADIARTVRYFWVSVATDGTCEVRTAPRALRWRLAEYLETLHVEATRNSEAFRRPLVALYRRACGVCGFDSGLSRAFVRLLKGIIFGRTAPAESLHADSAGQSSVLCSGGQTGLYAPLN